MKFTSKTYLRLFLILVVAHLLSILFKETDFRNFTKPLLMAALMGYANVSLAPGRWKLIILLALAFSWLGDVLLIFDGTLFFIGGLLSFLVAHVFYIVSYYMAVNDKPSISWIFKGLMIVLFGSYGISLFLKLYPNLDSLAVPVSIYAAVLVAMAAFASFRLGRTNWNSFILVLIGALFFIVSDSLIAFVKFGNTQYKFSFLIMLSYTLAQFWIISGLISHQKNEEETTDNQLQRLSRCPSCQTELQGEYCHACGQKVRKERLSIGILITEFLSSVFNLEKGGILTFKELLVKPHRMIHQYLGGNTVIYTNPFKYLFFTATLAAITSSFIDYDSMLPMIDTANGQDFNQKWIGFMRQYFTVMAMAFAPITAIASYWVYKKDRLNYSEHLVIACFATAQTSLMGIPNTLLIIAFPDQMINLFPLLILPNLFIPYAYFRIFSTKGFKGVLKSLGFFLIYIVMLIVIFGIIGTVFAMFTQTIPIN